MSDLARKKAERVWILRPDNLGDVVLFSGALRHIRAHYPQAEITLCVKEYVQNLVGLCPYVDRIVSWEDILRDMHYPFLSWLPAVRGRERLEYCLQRILMKLKYRADVLLLPVRSPTPLMHTLAKAMWADEKYGIGGDLCNQSAADDQRAAPIYTDRLRLPPERQRENELTVTRDYMRFIGMEVGLNNLWPQFWTDSQDKAWAEETINHYDGTFTLAIAPGVISLPGKSYPGANYAHVLSCLMGMDFAVLLFGSSLDLPMCEEVEHALAQCDNVVSIINLAGSSTVRQLVEGLRRCHAVLAQETAALHIAVALRKPTVAIIGGGHYGRFYPWGDPANSRVAHVEMDCYWCNWRCHHSAIRCVQEIPPSVIANELKAALNLGDRDLDSPRRLPRAIAG